MRVLHVKFHKGAVALQNFFGGRIPWPARANLVALTEGWSSVESSVRTAPAPASALSDLVSPNPYRGFLSQAAAGQCCSNTPNCILLLLSPKQNTP